MQVLILGARAPVCLEWARALHACGMGVTVADSVAWPLNRASRCIDGYVRLPEPRTALEPWIAAIARCVETEGIDLVLPTCEEVFYLAHAAQRLPERCRAFTSSFALLHGLHHKARFAELTAELPVRAPQTRLLETQSDVDALASRASDWVFKPAYSRFASRTMIRPTAKALRRVRPTPEQPWVAQRFVAGREHCSFSILIDGEVRLTAAYHPRYRVGRGSGILFEPTNPPQLAEFVAAFGRLTRYTGQVGFDFIEDADGALHVLECNPRATSGIHLFGDRPHALVEALTGSSAAPAPPASRAKMVALAMLAFAAPRVLARHPRAWPEFVRHYRAADDVIVQKGDCGPLFAQIPGFLEILLRSVTRRCSLLAAATSDIEWNGQPLGEART